MDQYNQNQYTQNQYNQNQYYQDQQYQQMQYQQPPEQYYGAQVPVSNNTFIRDLICSIIQMVLLPFFYGLIPLIITVLANDEWKRGNYESYEKKTKVAGIFLIIGWVFLALEVIAVIGIIAMFVGLVNSGF